MLNHQRLAQSLNIFAIFLRYPPGTVEFDSICQYFQTDWKTSWAVELSEYQDYSALSNLSALSADIWKQYFGVEYDLYAPPWGSVYTDPQGVLYGGSTMKLQDELEALGLKLCSSEKEPVDHIGLILMIMANLALSNHMEYLKDFQSVHLTSWVHKYINKLKEIVDEESILSIITLFEETLKWKYC